MLETRRIMASIDPSYEVEGPRYDVNQLMEVASTPAGRAARTTASGQMLTLTELQTRLEFAALLETRRRMEREPLDDKFMPGLADRFVAENPCPTSYRGARPKRTSMRRPEDHPATNLTIALTVASSSSEHTMRQMAGTSFTQPRGVGSELPARSIPPRTNRRDVPLRPQPPSR